MATDEVAAPLRRTFGPCGFAYPKDTARPVYNLAVARWKPERARKKEPGPVKKGQLISCLIVVVSALLLFWLLFGAILRR